MSGIVGLFNLDGRPADLGLAERMLRPIAYRGPDGCRTWTEVPVSNVSNVSPIAFGHCLLKTTREAISEEQPYAIPEAGLSVAFDGRLDNREELADAFDRQRIALTAEHDAAFVLAAY